MINRSIFFHYLRILGTGFLIHQVLRFGFLWYHKSSAYAFTFTEALQTAGLGFLSDGMVLCPALILALLTGFIFSGFRLQGSEGKTTFFFFIFLSVSVLLNLIDVYYFGQFGTRITYLAIEHVSDFGPIFKTILKSFPVFTFLIIFLVSLLFLGLFFRWSLPKKQNGPYPYPGWLILLIILNAGGSFLYLGPPLWKITSVSGNPLLNQGALNGFYSLIKSAGHRHQLQKDLPDFSLASPEKGIEILQELVQGKGEVSVQGISPLTRQLNESGEMRFEKVVLILLESFGANKTGCLNGGNGSSPRFDSLAAGGILFSDFYSNGPRTQLGLVSTLSGFPAILGGSLIRRKGTFEFFTLGHLFSEAGYTPRFFYGGDLGFDDMKSYLEQGGFSDLYSRRNFSKEAFNTEWGVSDDQLFDLAYNTIYQNKGKSLNVILTTGNHLPHEIPFVPPDMKGKEVQTGKDEMAFRFSDFALGEFIRKCRSHPDFEKTLFIILGDHSEKFRDGDTDLSIFHIPMLLLNTGLSPEVISKTGSQVDIATTLVHLCGIKTPFPFAGQNLLDLHRKSFAIIRPYENRIILVKDGRVGIGELETGDYREFMFDSLRHLKEKYSDAHSGFRKQFLFGYYRGVHSLYTRGLHRVK